MQLAAGQQPTSAPAADAGAAYYPPPGAGGPAGPYYPPPAGGGAPQQQADGGGAQASAGQNGASQQQAEAAATAGPVSYGAPAGPAAPPPGAKRGYERGGDGDGYTAEYSASDAKRQHMDRGAQPSPASVPRETVYRIVLDVVDTALIIGRGGNTVRQIEQTTGGRVKRLQEPPGAREQVVVVWTSNRELPSAGRVGRNAAQEALLDCVRRVVFQENAPMGQPMSVRMLINRTQEQGTLDNISSIVTENPGINIEVKRQTDLPACALDNDVLVELTGEKYSLMAAVEQLSHVLREHPIMERPGGAPPALRALAGPAAAAPAYAAPSYGGYGRY